jgi:hypothetical protein
VDIAYVPGNPTLGPSPLARFLPPLEQGSVRRALRSFGNEGDLILDPFGASPRLVVEAAQAGRAVLVAVNNPVTRYMVRHTVRPFSLDSLQASLASLASSAKDGGRLEPFMLDLYQTQCSRCGEWVSAEYFVWDKEVEEPVLRFYSCTHCNHTIEEPTTQEDRARAREFTSRSLHHALAVEQLAPRGSPDREHAEDALAVYPERAIFAIVTLLNKIQQLEPSSRAESAKALMLSALDQTNALWGHPEGRSRPLQLVSSARFVETNAWRALERAIGHWAIPPSSVEITDWTGNFEFEPGIVTVYPGSIRELADQIPSGAIDRILTVLPRPNQAFWTLSALWSAWLWDRASADPIRAVLRRRRYDWAWHAAALKATLGSLREALASSAEVIGLMPDAEPGFIAAALAGFDASGFRLTGRALRLAEQQAMLTWTWEGGSGPSHQATEFIPVMRKAALSALRSRAEPARYALPHAAAWSALASDRLLGNAQGTDSRSPIGAIGEELDRLLQDRKAFVHLSRGVEPESGRYWLTEEAGIEEPLADRIEAYVLRILRAEEQVDAGELDAQLCEALRGLQTPDRRFVMACLRSYALARDGFWRLREEDHPDSRAADRQEMVELLTELGRRLDYAVTGRDPVLWKDSTKGDELRFRVSENASVGSALNEADARQVDAIVIPGGRGALVAEKARRNPLLQAWLETSPWVIKYRHIRRLFEDTTLDRNNLHERLTLDPPGHEDPQLPLL